VGGGYVATATAAGTTTLTVGSARYQNFTGTNTQTVVTPDATTLQLGHSYLIDNNSTGSLTINVNGGANLLTLPSNHTVSLTCTSIGSAAGVWDVDIRGAGGMLPDFQWCKLNTAYTLTSSTALQKLFNASTNGALTLQGATQYFFECLYGITGMSATSGNASFDVLGAGTATLTDVHFMNVGLDNTTPATAAALSGGFASTKATTAAAAVAGTGTAMFNLCVGQINTNAAGTIIPSVALLTAAAATVAVGSYFKIWKAGASGQAFVGAWS
jgi:hypothetical protein